MAARRIAAAIAALSVAVSVSLVAGAQAADSGWTAAQIGETQFTALAVNDAGVVAGYVGVYPNNRAAVWSDGTTTFLTTPEGTIRSVAVGINSHGQVVGSIEVQTEADLRQEAVLWDADGTMNQLGFLPGGIFSAAQDINDNGQVVGVTGVEGHYEGFLWDGDGPITALPMPSGMTNAFAVAINDLGHIVGSASAMSQPSRAVLWQDGQATALTPLAEGATATATDINDSGQVVGNSATTAPPWSSTHPVLWEEGTITDLGSLGGAFASAQAINNTGQVVGLMTDAAGYHAFVWKDSASAPLPPLVGDTESGASDINALGQVVGWSGPPFAATRAVMWTTRSDTAPPEITVPADLAFNATSPAGAVVEFTATAKDEDPANPTVTCAPPSGSTFPIGDTTVTCTATDAAGNTASASFTVHVKGASEQVADLMVLVDSYNLALLGTALHDKLVKAQGFLAANKPRRACEVLDRFLAQVREQRGKRISIERADKLTADAQRIKAVIGC